MFNYVTYKFYYGLCPLWGSLGNSSLKSAELGGTCGDNLACTTGDSNGGLSCARSDGGDTRSDSGENSNDDMNQIDEPGEGGSSVSRKYSRGSKHYGGGVRSGDEIAFLPGGGGILLGDIGKHVV